jgi:hypothetical protein
MSWTHKPRLPILIWCLWVFPFTLWDTLYLCLRPHSLPGGKWHDRYFSRTFAIWASIDRSYGDQGWLDQDGFVLAQSVINMVEAFLCVYYVWTIWKSGNGGLRAPVSGRAGARALLIGLCAGYVTLTKTSLYCKSYSTALFITSANRLVLRECFSGYRYTGHNDWKPFLTTWIGMKYDQSLEHLPNS